MSKKNKQEQERIFQDNILKEEQQRIQEMKQRLCLEKQTEEQKLQEEKAQLYTAKLLLLAEQIKYENLTQSSEKDQTEENSSENKITSDQKGEKSSTTKVTQKRKCGIGRWFKNHFCCYCNCRYLAITCLYHFVLHHLCCVSHNENCDCCCCILPLLLIAEETPTTNKQTTQTTVVLGSSFYSSVIVVAGLGLLAFSGQNLMKV